MPGYIYDQTGKPLAFHSSGYVYTFSGIPIGRIRNTRVYKINGEYVGELDKGLVLDKSIRNIGRLHDPAKPMRGHCPQNPGKRVAIKIPFPDAFYKLKGE